jgi:hypothetical protein
MTEADSDALTPADDAGGDPFAMRDPRSAAAEAAPLVHLIRKGIRCGTEKRGYATPDGESPLRIVVDASEGIIPLWAQNTTLRWRFQERSMRYFRNPTAAKAAIERLLGESLLAWGDAMPVRFTKHSDLWDFEIVMSASDDCDGGGCVLASAFFPDPGRHELWLYPKMLTQTRNEQIETLVHEVGHIFGLRHFFAQISEGRWPSEVFGKHVEFSIMNYGEKSRLTSADKADLKRLYQAAWGGDLTHINGTPIRFVRPFHDAGSPTPDGGIFGLAAAMQGFCPPAAATFPIVPQPDGGAGRGGRRAGTRGGGRSGGAGRRAGR